MGYPVGNKLNELLLKSNEEKFSFSSCGSLAINIDGTKPDFGYKTSYETEFEFCFDLIHYFKEKKGEFDYEEFYDFIIDELDESEEDIIKIAERHRNQTNSISSLVNGTKKVFPQVVSFFLKDSDGRKYYDDLPYSMGLNRPGYSGIMKCISDFGKESIVNIHTLNHDLFFESFNRTDFLKGNLSDGFEELGSPYYGKLICNNRGYRVRLPYYNGKYDTNFRLYKLHGSLDYVPFFNKVKDVFIPDNYIKTPYGIGLTELYKEIEDEKGKLVYENCWINYHSDFLTGTTSKIQRYSEPLIFNKLFSIFKQNLENSEKLIIIGYGAKDKEINNMILNHFNHLGKKSFIIDPFAGETVKKLASTIGSKLIKKHLEHINTDDLY